MGLTLIASNGGELPTFVSGGTVLAPSGQMKNATLVIGGTRILEVSERRAELPSGSSRIDASGHYVCPGLLDTHIHGYRGHDVMAGAAGVRGMSVELAAHGVTGFLPTLLGCRAEVLQALVEEVAAVDVSGASIYGVHLEGPALDCAMPGMLDPGTFRTFHQEEIADLAELVDDCAVVMTIACHAERTRTLSGLIAAGIIPSLGHASGTYEDVLFAIDAGVRRATHCFNAMTGFHHRDPGILGGILASGEIRAELVLDGRHVHPGAASILVSLKGSEGVILATDSTKVSGCGDGVYDWSGYTIEVCGGTARLQDGTLAGSVLTMDEAVANAVSMLDISLDSAVEMASLTPARSVGIDHVTGSLVRGKNADITILSSKLEPVMTIVSGEIVWKN